MGLIDELSKIDTLDGKQLSDVGEAVNELEGVRSKIAEHEASIKELQGREYQLENEVIPGFLDTGIKEIKLNDGSKISIKDITRANITKDNEEYCYGWLTDHGLDDVIKNVVSSTFGRGQNSDAQELMKRIEDMGLIPENKKSVAWNTLSKLVEEQMQKGSMTSDVQEKFGVYIQRKVKIERKK